MGAGVGGFVGDKVGCLLEFADGLIDGEDDGSGETTKKYDVVFVSHDDSTPDKETSTAYLCWGS